MTSRLVADAYETPLPLAVAIVRMLIESGLWSRSSACPRILEPSVGIGRFVEAILYGGQAPYYSIDCCDVRNVPSEFVRDAKDVYFYELPFEEFAAGERTKDGYDLIIGNPPYGGDAERRKQPGTLAEDHIRLALGLLKPQGVLAFLLRINFLAGIERGPAAHLVKTLEPGLWTMDELRYVYALDKRPGFLKGSGTDVTEYGVFIFHHPDPSRPQEPILRFLSWVELYRLMKPPKEEKDKPTRKRKKQS